MPFTILRNQSNYSRSAQFLYYVFGKRFMIRKHLFLKSVFILSVKETHPQNWFVDKKKYTGLSTLTMAFSLLKSMSFQRLVLI